MNLSQIDFSETPPRIAVPRRYNAAVDLIERNLPHNADKPAFIDAGGPLSYAELAARVNRAGNALRDLGLQPEQRVLMLMLDTVAFPAVFLGAIKAGLVPVPVNTMLTGDDYLYMLNDSRAPALAVSAALLPVLGDRLAEAPHLRHVIVADGEAGANQHGLAALMDAAAADLAAADTTADDVAFWLYSSGSTGRPKGAAHLQSDLVNTAALYGVPVLGITADDVVYSAAKLFFAYGLGNALTFPLFVGASAVLLADRPTPDLVMATLKAHDASLFFGVPTLYAAILADPGLDRAAGSPGLRLCVSAGEALPADVARRWVERFGVDILDGIGSTEMLHIFLSNAPDDIRYGSTGKPVPGYRVLLVDESGHSVGDGEIGDLLVNGPSSAPWYWNNRDKSIATFQGAWTHTGDKYRQDEDGYFVYCGRSDDMLKVGGIWVSPFEVESTLMQHDAVLEAAVVGDEDSDGLIKPHAHIVLNDGSAGDDVLAAALQDFVKDRLARYKYPRWISFIDTLPKTATGKIQRYKLR